MEKSNHPCYVFNIVLDKHVLMAHGDTEGTQKSWDILQKSKAWKEA